MVGRKQLSHYSKASRELVLEMQRAGWEGEMRASGHVYLKAPDGVTTTTVSRGSNGRTLANSRSVFDRWVKDTTTEILVTYVENHPEEFIEVSVATEPVVTVNPYFVQNGAASYPSKTVNEYRTDGQVTHYGCRYEGCEYTSSRHLSVANHFKVHKNDEAREAHKAARVAAVLALADEPDVVDEFSEPVPEVTAVVDEAVVAAAVEVKAESESLAGEMLERIRAIVLPEALKALEEDLAAAVKARDEALVRAEKAEGDLRTLRDLIGSVVPAESP